MIVWIDGSAGASGDMFLGALVDLGVPLDVLQAPLDQLGLGITLRREQVTRASLGATKIHVDVPETRTLRHLPEIIELFSVLDRDVRVFAEMVFNSLAHAEAVVHRVPAEEIHFHEVGALDSIADVVATCAGFAHLQRGDPAFRVHCSTLSLGSGQTRGAHGPIPVPTPAVLQLLDDGRAPVQAGRAPFESTTPTGAAILATLVRRWGPMPAMTIDRVGMGAGTKDPDGFANVLRMVTGVASDPALGAVGAAGGTPQGTATGEMIQIDTNIDDMDARLFPAAIDAALAAGAVDAWVTPIVMKKGRPAYTFSVLTDDIHVWDVRESIFRNTTTIGLRERAVQRHTLGRAFGRVEVDGQTIGVKHSSLRADTVNSSVEWDDVVAAAAALGRPVADVLADAERAVETPAPHPPLGDLD